MTVTSVKCKGIFITATDTDAGKTLISGAIAKILSQKGKKIGVFKPVATGCRVVDKQLVSQDAEFLKYCANSELALEAITPIRYKTPAAPPVCEKAEKKKVELSKIFKAYKQICRNCDFVVVEGIGGVKVPLTDNFDVLDLVKALKLPVIIVARAKLGTINHTLLTIEAVRRRGLLLAGVIVNGYDEKTADFAEKTNAAIIKKLGKVKILAVVPDDKKTDMAKKIIGRKVMNTLRKVDWFKIK